MREYYQDVPVFVLEELEEIRESGVTNMFDRRVVVSLLSPAAAMFYLTWQGNHSYVDLLNIFGEWSSQQ